MKALILVAFALMCVAARCGPGGAPPAPPPPSSLDASAPVEADAGTDPIALRLCLENFEQLNPCDPQISCLTEAQIQALFCSTPEALAPWARQAIVNPKAQRSDAGAR